MIGELISGKVNLDHSLLGAGDVLDLLDLVKALNRLSCVFHVNLSGVEVYIDG